MKTQATMELETIIAEFETDVIPFLQEYFSSPDVQAAISQVNPHNHHEVFELSDKLRVNFKAPNYVGLIERNGVVVPVLYQEAELDEVGIFDRVYQAILKEVRVNLHVDGKTFFYPAIGHDWRIAKAWPETRFIAVDPFEMEARHFEEPNVYFVVRRAQDYETVKAELESGSLPTKANLILKGSGSAIESQPLDLPDLSALWPLRKIKEVFRLLSRSKPAFDPDFDKKAFQRFVENYLASDGLIIALDINDIIPCDNHLLHFNKRCIVSPQFKEALQRWNYILENYAAFQPAGFWRPSNEPFAYTRAT